jgi:undecaprenyl pyrophosphate synthase
MPFPAFLPFVFWKLSGERFFDNKMPFDHVAFIMDGNGRWAKARGLPRYLGHKEACNRIIELFEVCREFNINTCPSTLSAPKTGTGPKTRSII